jgi:hypothetical protein
MADHQSGYTDPQDFFKSLWSSMSIPLPGMVTPTLDPDELGKRIADLKAVEGWLKMNLNMLQMTIQGLEMQRFTINAMQHAFDKPEEAPPQSDANPFSNPALWPWNFMSTPPGAPAETAAKTEAATPADKKG